MITILGAGGSVGNELVKELAGKGRKIRLVGRKPQPASAASEVFAADLSVPDQTMSAVSGSEVVYLLAGLKYDLRVWQDLWPKIMRNTIEACKRAKARLVFFDNVYMYGKVTGPMTEETPFNPCSRKGEIRARIATLLLNEIQQGTMTAAVARSADFYGPHAKNSVPGILVFDKLAKGAKAAWMANDSVKHSFTFTPDAAKCLALFSEKDKGWNQTWHVPTAADPPTGKQFIEMAAHELGVKPTYRILSRPALKLAGFFNRDIQELYEMLYQYESDYIFDSSKFEKAFQFKPTSYSEGIRLSASAGK